MKNLIIKVLVIIILPVSLNAQKNQIVLVHPTEYNLELFTNLIDKNIVEIGNCEIVGVYHHNEAYDYTESHAYLEEKGYTHIKLVEVKEDIEPNQLYKENNCSNIFNKLYQNSKGIIFFGGPDMPPSIYGEQMSLLTRMTDPFRHYFEASFLFHLLGGYQNDEYKPLLENNPDFPIYAICLGMQTMNVATGGTMVQDIPSEIYNLKFVEEVLTIENNKQHRNYNNNLIVDSTLFSGNFHQIKVTNSKPIVGNYSDNLFPLIYSNHHQAIEKLGKNLGIVATSMDGKIIEAISHKNYPNVLGIQFHPEGKYLHDYAIKYRKKPTDKLRAGKQILEESNSYQFHIELWKTFSFKINSIE